MHDLIAYFKNAILPTVPVKINRYATVSEATHFVANAIERASNGNELAREQLEQLRDYIEANRADVL